MVTSRCGATNELSAEPDSAICGKVTELAMTLLRRNCAGIEARWTKLFAELLFGRVTAWMTTNLQRPK
jgi:hypothetical protein